MFDAQDNPSHHSCIVHCLLLSYDEESPTILLFLDRVTQPSWHRRPSQQPLPLISSCYACETLFLIADHQPSALPGNLLFGGIRDELATVCNACAQQSINRPDITSSCRVRIGKSVASPFGGLASMAVLKITSETVWYAYYRASLTARYTDLSSQQLSCLEKTGFEFCWQIFGCTYSSAISISCNELLQCMAWSFH